MNGKRMYTYETGHGLELLDIFYHGGDEELEEGWYAAFYTPGHLYEGEEPLGPYSSAEAAYDDVVAFYELDLKEI